MKNVSAKTEGEYLAEELFDRRTAMRNAILASLIAERDALRAQADLAKSIATCVDRALELPKSIERSFWLDALATFIVCRT